LDKVESIICAIENEQGIRGMPKYNLHYSTGQQKFSVDEYRISKQTCIAAEEIVIQSSIYNYLV
jgi:hypothetical protein